MITGDYLKVIKHCIVSLFGKFGKNPEFYITFPVKFNKTELENHAKLQKTAKVNLCENDFVVVVAVTKIKSTLSLV